MGKAFQVSATDANQYRKRFVRVNWKTAEKSRFMFSFLILGSVGNRKCHCEGKDSSKMLTEWIFITVETA